MDSDKQNCTTCLHGWQDAETKVIYCGIRVEYGGPPRSTKQEIENGVDGRLKKGERWNSPCRRLRHGY